jgi:3-hydroxyacyl-[acyl-carrier-protein] dehydratase
VPARESLIDPRTIDFSKVVADIQEIRSRIPQRFEMEQLTAIVVDEPQQGLCVAYHDLSPNAFWVSGHMPGMPLMPGILMCEAAAQVCSYHTMRHDLLGSEMLGFGALDKVRFRGIVRPGDRLVIACQMLKVRRGRMVVCRFEAYVGDSVVCEGELSGVALPVDQLRGSASTNSDSSAAR